MEFKNLLILTPEFPDKYNKRISGIFVKEQVKYLGDYFENLYVVSPTSVWREYLFKNHVEDYGWDNVRVYHPLYVNFPIPYIGKYLKRFWIYLEKRAILKLLKTEKIKFNLIHAHYTWPTGAIAVELKKEFKVPVIITEHTHISLYKALKRKDPYYLQTWKSCDAIIRVNKKDVPLFKKFNENTVNIPNGFDEKKFYSMKQEKCREKLNLPLDKKIILSVGNLIEVKGHKYAIEAMNEILRKRKDVLYIIGGSGPLREKLQKQIKDLGIQDCVKLIGFVPDDKINLWMNACDLFVLPSLSEGNPTVMFECLGCGKPFIGTKVGGEPEIITSEDYGYLVEPANPKELSEKILIALDKEWDEEYILNYAKQFTWGRIAEEIIGVYKEVMTDET